MTGIMKDELGRRIMRVRGVKTKDVQLSDMLTRRQKTQRSR